MQNEARGMNISIINLIYELNDEMLDKLKELKAEHIVQERNYDRRQEVSSIHFLGADMKEVAYLIPSMHCYSLGKLSGFNVISREYTIPEGLVSLPIIWK